MTMMNAFDGKTDDRLDTASRAMIADRDRLLGPAYRLFYQQPLHFVQGEGVWLIDPQGNRYLDAYNNVASLGHCHPRVVEAICRQSATLNTHTRYLHRGVLDYAERLLSTMPEALGHIMYTCTGSEANDLALRIAREWSGHRGIIVTANAYHGVTEAVAEVSPSLGARLGAHVRTVELPATCGNTAEEFASAVRQATEDLAASGYGTAALLVDTVFSSDGVRPDLAGILAPAAAIVREAGGLLIADEVQAGFGRLGDHFWGFARHDVTPDLVTMGKPMGNGHPVAAVVCRPETIEAFGAATRYFNTFGGNPVSIAAATAVLDVIEEEALLENARDVGGYLADGLVKLGTQVPFIGEVRACGFFAGVDIVDDNGSPDPDMATRVVNAMRERFVLISATGACGHVLKIRPPLVFERQHADILVDTLAHAVAA